MKNQRRKGNSAIELALTIGALVPLFTGAVEGGREFYLYNRLVSAAGAGAQYASELDYRSKTGEPDERFLQQVRDFAVYGKRDPGPGDEPVVHGLTPDNIEVSAEMRAGKPRTITVRVRRFEVDSVFSPIQYDGIPHATFPYTGR